MIRFIPQAVNDIIGLTAGTCTMNVLSAGTDDIATETGITISAATIPTISSGTYSIISVTYSTIIIESL